MAGISGKFPCVHAGLGVAVGLHKDDLDGVSLRDAAERVGRHRAHALAVDQHLGHRVALVRGDGEGLVAADGDVGPAGGGDGAVPAHRDHDGAVVVAVAVAGIILRRTVQHDFTADGGVVPVGRREPPFVGLAGPDHGVGRQHIRTAKVDRHLPDRELLPESAVLTETAARQKQNILP